MHSRVFWLNNNIQILTAHEGEWWKIIVPKVNFNLGLLFTEARRAEVNSKPRLNFTEGTIIFYISRIKEQSIFALYIPFIDFLVRTEP